MEQDPKSILVHGQIEVVHGMVKQILNVGHCFHGFSTEKRECNLTLSLLCAA